MHCPGLGFFRNPFAAQGTNPSLKAERLGEFFGGKLTPRVPSWTLVPFWELDHFGTQEVRTFGKSTQEVSKATSRLAIQGFSLGALDETPSTMVILTQPWFEWWYESRGGSFGFLALGPNGGNPVGIGRNAVSGFAHSLPDESLIVFVFFAFCFCFGLLLFRFSQSVFQLAG